MESTITAISNSINMYLSKKTLCLDNKEIEKRGIYQTFLLKEKSNINVKICKTHAFKLLHLFKVTDK